MKRYKQWFLQIQDEVLISMQEDPEGEWVKLTDAKDQQDSKDRAYDERNRLVAALSKLYPSSLSRHPEDDKDWEDDWRWIVFITLPTGQASWHIHDSHLPLFTHLPRSAAQWDGHTTEEKYRRIERLQVLEDLL